MTLSIHSKQAASHPFIIKCDGDDMDEGDSEELSENEEHVADEEAEFTDLDEADDEVFEDLDDEDDDMYKIQLMVSDEEDEACFIIFDHLAFKTFNKTASDMLKELEQIGDIYGFPPVFYTLCDKEFAFLIDINEQFNVLKKKNSYSILQMTDDDKIIDAFHANKCITQDMVSTCSETRDANFNTPESGSYKKKIKRNDGDNELDNLGISEIQTPQFSSSKITHQFKKNKQNEN
ncbi:hypothetical protein RIF29_34764 [Crotalaria pallida]|uniref:Uncharacterized protein n=1 Tax=Crotalaria pallida TaxID=3830 RepID=A0AAN9E980_CROPI